MNKWIGIGRLTKAPELRKTPTGKSVTTFSLAIDDGYGEKKTTDYIDIVVWDKPAENCAKYLDKGSKVAIVGKIKKRSYEKDGHKVWITEVVAQEVEFLDSKNANTAPSQPQAPQAPQAPQYPGNFAEVHMDDSDLPF